MKGKYGQHLMAVGDWRRVTGVSLKQPTNQGTNQEKYKTNQPNKNLLNIICDF